MSGCLLFLCMFLLKKYNFIKICNIKPREDDGLIKEFYPQKRYVNRKGYSLHKYGEGHFCEFSINKRYKDEGVYFFRVGEKIKYIGKCDNLYRRIYKDYGHIQPRNCYVKGQSTNCRINKLIIETAKSNQEIKLYFLKTSNKNIIEKELIGQYKPEWNIQLKQ